MRAVVTAFFAFNAKFAREESLEGRGAGRGERSIGQSAGGEVAVAGGRGSLRRGKGQEDGGRGGRDRY